jgi:hypothetical protein
MSAHCTIGNQQRVSGRWYSIEYRLTEFSRDCDSWKPLSHPTQGRQPWHQRLVRVLLQIGSLLEWVFLCDLRPLVSLVWMSAGGRSDAR